MHPGKLCVAAAAVVVGIPVCWHCHCGHPEIFVAALMTHHNWFDAKELLRAAGQTVALHARHRSTVETIHTRRWLQAIEIALILGQTVDVVQRTLPTVLVRKSI